MLRCWKLCRHLHRFWYMCAGCLDSGTARSHSSDFRQGEGRRTYQEPGGLSFGIEVFTKDNLFVCLKLLQERQSEGNALLEYALQALNVLFEDQVREHGARLAQALKAQNVLSYAFTLLICVFRDQSSFVFASSWSKSFCSSFLFVWSGCCSLRWKSRNMLGSWRTVI